MAVIPGSECLSWSKKAHQGGVGGLLQSGGLAAPWSRRSYYIRDESREDIANISLKAEWDWFSEGLEETLGARTCGAGQGPVHGCTLHECLLFWDLGACGAMAPSQGP